MRHHLMFPVLAIARDGLAAQSRKLEGVALVVALEGVQQTAASTPAPAISVGSPVRIGALPLGSSAESLVSMREAELAYRMNAAVLSTAGEMFDALLDAVDGDKR